MPSNPQLPPWRSVRVRVAALATAVVAVALVAAGYALVRVIEHQLVDKVRADTDAQLAVVATRLESGVQPQQAVQPRATGVIVGVVSASGQPIAGPPLPIGNGQSVFVTGDVGPGEKGGGVVTTQTADGAGIATGTGRLDIRYEGVATPNGTVTVVAAAPLSGVSQSIATLEHTLWIALPLVLAVVAAVAWAMTGRALRPVDAIRAEVDEITASTIHRRVPEPATGDEVARLAHTMNAMLDRLESASRRQREFVADASHELRSPVASMRTQLEVALADGPNVDWSAVATSVLDDEARLEALVADLLLLATVDDASPRTDERVDVAALVDAEAAKPRGLPVDTVTDGEGLVVAGNESLLVRAVANLLDNAARYARELVRVTVAAHGDVVVIDVDDDGPGIPAADRARVFERFARLDTARARAGATDGGAGLGLALVRAIVDQHHGTVSADASPLGGARLTLRLPRATS